MNNFKQQNPLILIVFLYLSILVDYLSGFLKIGDENSINNSPIAILFKGLLIILLISYAPRLNRIVLVSVTLISIQTFFSSLNDSIFLFVFNLIASFKLLLFIIIYYNFDRFVKIKQITSKSIFNILKFTFITIIINQILGKMGFGKATYTYGDIRIGTTGFFFESNAYSYIFLLVSMLLYLRIEKTISNQWKIVYFCLNVIVAITIAMKVAILGTILMMLIFLWKKNKLIIVILVSIIICFIVIFSDVILESDQMIYYIEHYSSDDTNSAVFSGRESRLQNSIPTYLYKFSFYEQVFGIGQNRMLNDRFLGGASEMDYIDVVKSNGIIGFFIVFGSFLWICNLQWKMYKRTKFPEFRIVLIFNLIILIASSLAGHVFASGSTPIYLALFNIYPFALHNENLIKNNLIDSK
jgi:hypothetical protein